MRDGSRQSSHGADPGHPREFGLGLKIGFFRAPALGHLGQQLLIGLFEFGGPFFHPHLKFVTGLLQRVLRLLSPRTEPANKNCARCELNKQRQRLAVHAKRVNRGREEIFDYQGAEDDRECAGPLSTEPGTGHHGDIEEDISGRGNNAVQSKR